MTKYRPFAVFVLLLFCGMKGQASTPDITPELVARCKQATAFVIVGEDDSGTAFHIGKGLFITNSHVVEDATSEDKIRLVLNAGESDQKILMGTLLRADDKLDLALLKVDETKLPPFLELGDVTTLVETAGITAFGYPYGKSLAVGKNEFPNITVSIGRITSLRKDAGKVQRIQIDASLNPGNSGGPIVSNSGQVLGVVESGIVGTGVSFAIPVDLLRRFLYGPTLSLRAPSLQKAVPGNAETFTIDLFSGENSGKDLSINLLLSTNGQDKREYKASDIGGGHFTLSAPLLPALGPDVLEASIDDRDGSYSLRIRDRMVQVGGRMIKLSALREITQGSAPMIVFANGQKLAGSLVGLKTVETWKNGKPSPIDLSTAYKITLSLINQAVKTVRYEIALKRGGTSLATQKGVITTEGVVPDVIITAQASEKASVPVVAPRITVLINDDTYTTTDLGETLQATFTTPDGGVTSEEYSGYVLVTIAGAGQAYTPSYNDAFYLFNGAFTDPQNGHDGGFYQMTFGTSTLGERDLGSNAKNFLACPLPPYNPAHRYTVVIDTKLSKPGRLHFGVSDGGYNDNTGAFTIRVTQLAPKP